MTRKQYRHRSRQALRAMKKEYPNSGRTRGGFYGAFRNRNRVFAYFSMHDYCMDRESFDTLAGL